MLSDQSIRFLGHVGGSLSEVEMKPCSRVEFLGLLQYKYNLINEKEKLLTADMNY